MALKESEVRILSLLGLIICILWIFFGLFWSLLLVFTFLIYAYKFGRTQHVRSWQSYEKIKEKVDDDPAASNLKWDDVPFTGGLPGSVKENLVSLRSPVPLLSEVTRRLSYSMSKTTPFPNRNTARYHAHAMMPKQNFNSFNNTVIRSWHSKQFVSPYRSRGRPYHRKPNQFSLLNPVSHQPPTVKIAAPDVLADGTLTMCESPMKRAVKVVENPCSKEAVISAIKQSRKRSIIDDNEMELTSRPAKRRSYRNEVVDKTRPESLWTGFGVKRPVLPECTFEGVKESSATKPESYAALPKRSKTADKQDVTNHKRKVVGDDTIPKTSQLANNANHSNSEEDLGVKSKKAKAEPQTEQIIQRSSPVKNNNGLLQSPTVDRKDCQNIIGETFTTKESQETYVTKVQQADTTISGQNQQERNNKKRFVVPRFPSKDDSRRRTVPVYCASTATESDMPQRRAAESRKITRELIQIDRQLAWERVRRLLDEVDEEAEEKSGTKQDNQPVIQKTLEDVKAVPSTTCQTTGPVPVASVTLSSSSSSSKIPAVGTATSSRDLNSSVMGSIQNTLSTPVDTTSKPGRPELSDARPVAQGVPLVGTAVTRHLFSAVTTVKTPNALSSGLVPSFSTGLSTTVTPALSNVPIFSGVQDKSLKVSVEAISSSSTTLTFSHVNTGSASTVTTSQSAPGIQRPSAVSFSHVNSGSASTVTTSQSAPGIQRPSAVSFSHVNTGSTSTLTTSQSAPGIQVPSAVSLFGNSLPNSRQSTLPAVSAPKSTSSGVSNTAHQSFGFATPSTGSTARKGGFAFAAVTSSGYSQASSPALSTIQQHSGSSSGPSLGAFASAPGQSSFGFGNTSIQSGFGNSSILKHSGLESTNQSKLTFGATNIQGTFGSSQQFQDSFNPPSGTATGVQQNTSTFGAPPSKGVFMANPNKTATQNPFGDPPTHNAFGLNVSQNTTQAPFGSVATQNAFTIQPNQTTTPSGFGSQLKKSSTQNSFGIQPVQGPFGLQANINTNQSPFGAMATQNAFGTPTKQPATQSTFGGQSVQNVFGGQPNQTFPQSTFGSHSFHNTFGTQPNQNAFGGSQFSFSGSQNSAQTTANSPFAGFENTASSSQASSTVSAKQKTFGQGSSQNTTNNSGGFNFNSSANNAKSGGFNFGAAANQTAQFQSGPSSTTAFGSFSQTPAQPSAVPASPAPSGGFNFAPGSSGMSGSPFAASSTPQGNSSAAAARTRARVAARRRGRK